MTKTLAAAGVFVRIHKLHYFTTTVFLRWYRRRLQCVNQFYPAIALSYAFPFSLSLFLARVHSLTHQSTHSRLSFHSRENFIHSSYSGEEAWRNVIVVDYLDIATFFTYPRSSNALVLAAEKSKEREAVNAGRRVCGAAESAMRTHTTKWDQWTTCSEESCVSG